MMSSLKGRIEESNIVKSRYFIPGVIILLDFVCLCCISYLEELNTDTPVHWAAGYQSLIWAAVIFWFLKRFRAIDGGRLKKYSIILGLLLSASYVAGYYLDYVNNLLITPLQTLGVLGLILGIGIFTVPLSGQLMLFLDRHFIGGREASVQVSGKVFFKYWLGIFVCYLPVFIANWPVNFVFDGKFQLSEVVNEAYHTHHPLLHTWLMGFFYKLGGRVFGSVSIGISFYTIIQMLFLSGCFAYALWYLYHKNVSRTGRIIAFLFFAVCPVNSLFAVSSTKDVLFAGSFLVFLIEILRLCHEQEKLRPAHVVRLLLFGVLMALLRNNAFYALVAALPFLLYARKGAKRRLALAGIFLAVILASRGCNTALINALNAIDVDSYRETMNIPLQQLARVAWYRGYDLSEELYDEITLYISEDDLSKYNPFLSDMVKNNANEELLKTNTLNFFKLWLKVGLQFPGEYIEAFLSNTVGYWSLANLRYAVIQGDELAMYHTLIGSGEEIVKAGYFPGVTELYEFLFLYGNRRSVPGLDLFFRPSTYFIAFFLLLFFCIYKKRGRFLAPLALMITYILTCLLGPCAALRYVYCIAVSLPVLIALLFSGHAADKEAAVPAPAQEAAMPASVQEV